MEPVFYLDEGIICVVIESRDICLERIEIISIKQKDRNVIVTDS